MNATTKLHVVLGAGQVGPRLAERLLAAGHRVRIVRRKSVEPSRLEPRPDLEWVRADLGDPEAATRACAGADVIYDCTNPSSYGSWHETLAPLKRGVREAAARTGALLVSLDNLYVYGRPEGVITETTPTRPCSGKGALRLELTNDLMEAHARGELRATIARASDYFGPGTEAMSMFGTPLVRGLARGRAALVVGDPDLPRSYSYVPDVVSGLAALGEQPDRAAGKTFHLPVAWKDGTTRAFVQRFADELGVAPRLRHVPRWGLRAAGIFSRDLGAVAEMVYQWEVPYVVDDARFAETFGVRATPMNVAVRASVQAAMGGAG